MGVAVYGVSEPNSLHDVGLGRLLGVDAGLTTLIVGNGCVHKVLVCSARPAEESCVGTCSEDQFR